MKKRLFAITMALCLAGASAGVYAEETTEAATEAATEAITEAASEETEASEEETTAAVDGEVTAESLLTGQTDAESMSGKMTMNLDGALKMSDGTSESSIGLVVGGDFDLQAIVEPLQFSLSGNYDMSILGQSQDASMEVYAVTADDNSSIDVYAKTVAGEEESDWEHYQVTAEDITSAFNVSSTDDIGELVNGGELSAKLTDLDWTLEEKDDTYVLSADVDIESMITAIGGSLDDILEASGATDDMTKELVTSCLDGLVVSISYTFDQETKLPTAFHMDLNKSDLTNINAIVSLMMALETYSEDETEESTESTVEYEIILNDLSFDGVYTYDDVTTIEVPADALTAPISDTTSAEDMVSGIVEENVSGTTTDSDADTAETETETELAEEETTEAATE